MPIRHLHFSILRGRSAPVSDVLSLKQFDSGDQWKGGPDDKADNQSDGPIENASGEFHQCCAGCTKSFRAIQRNDTCDSDHSYGVREQRDEDEVICQLFSKKQ